MESFRPRAEKKKNDRSLLPLVGAQFIGNSHLHFCLNEQGFLIVLSKLWGSISVSKGHPLIDAL